MFHRILLAASFAMAASLAGAQLAPPLSLEIVHDGTPVLAATGLTQTEFDGFAIDPTGTTVNLFDSQSGFDGIVRITGGVGTVFATADQLTGVGVNSSASDITANDTHVYISVRGSGGQRSIWRYPHTATNFSEAVRMVETGGATTTSNEIDIIACDDKNGRLILGYNAFGNNSLEQIGFVPYTAVDAVPTILVDQATLNAALATIPGYVDATTNPVDIIDMTVQSNGDIIFSNGFASNNPLNGSLLRVTETGTVSVFRTADQIRTAAGAPAGVNIGSVSVVALPNDDIFICAQFSSNNTDFPPFMAVVSADGLLQRHIGTSVQMLGALTPAEQAVTVASGQSLFNFDFRHNLGVDVDGDVYFHRQSTNKAIAEQSAVFKISGVVASGEGPTHAASWEMYQ